MKHTFVSHFLISTSSGRTKATRQVNRQRLTKLAEWVDQNNIKVNIDKTFSLDEAAKALDYQKEGHPRGKLVLTI